MIGLVAKVSSNPVYFGVLGAASIGLGVGAYFLCDFIDRKRNRYADEQFAMYDELHPEEDDGLPHIPEGVNEVADEDEKVIAPGFRKPDISEMVDYTKYAKMSREYDTAEPDMADLRNAETVNAEEGDDSWKFREITEIEYLDPSNGMSKVDATYFTQERMLAGWNDELAERDIESTIGSECLKAFDDPKVRSVYVRNLEMGIDYEIVRCDDAYEEVLRESLSAEE